MKHNVSSTFAALLVAAFVSVGFSGVVSAQADAKQNSKVAGPVLKAAKASLDAKKYSDAIAKLKEVQGLSGKNAYDEHLTNEMLYFAYARSNNYAEAAKVLEGTLDSQFVPKSEQPKRIRQLLQLNYQLKNYDKVIAFGDRAIKDGFADDEIYTWVGQAYYLKGDFKGTQKFVDSYVGNQSKAGKRPKEQTLLLLQSACEKTGDVGCRQRVFENLVAHYPKPQYWQNLMDAMTRAQSGQSEKVQLQVYRLAAAVDVPLKPSDYMEFAQLALEAGSPGEAQAILEKGFQKKVFTEPRVTSSATRLLDNAKKQVTTDQAQLEKVARDAASSSSGDKDVSVGLAYLGYQQYDKAVEAINRGLGKPGLQNAAEARLLLGIAELNAGRKDEARKAFKQVKGDPTLERLANLWSLHSQA